MTPLESSEFEIGRVSDLNRLDGETIHLDYHDLYDLASLETWREEAFQAEDGFRPLAPQFSDFDSSGREEVRHVTSALKEYTDLSNKIVIENSIESIRNVIEVTNIPPINRHIIERSIDTLQTAIDISEYSISDKEIPIQKYTDLMPECMRTGYPLVHVEDSEDSYGSLRVGNGRTKVSLVSVDAEIVREALGISNEDISNTNPISLYNTSFSRDRERHIQVWFTSLLTHTIE